MTDENPDTPERRRLDRFNRPNLRDIFRDMTDDDAYDAGDPDDVRERRGE